MARKKKAIDPDGKSAAAGEDLDAQPEAPPPGATAVFDAPLDDAEAIARLIDLNHERTACVARWEDAKAEAAEAKKELDNASNAIALLIDQIDRQRNGGADVQPVLATLGDVASAPQ